MPEKEIIIFDVPGVGRSEMSWRPRRFSGLARLANKLLDRLGYQQVDVIGVSWGGALAQQFARQYPQRCRRLVLAATSPGAIMVPGRPSALSKMMTPRRYLSPTYMQKAAGDIYGGEARRDPEAHVRAHGADHSAAVHGLRLPAARRHGLDQHSLAASDPPTHAGHGGIGRPAGAAGECADHRHADSQQPPATSSPAAATSSCSTP